MKNIIFNEIKSILVHARGKAFRTINLVMVEAYWSVGRRIVQEEQNGNTRAEYGEQLLKNLSVYLTQEFGKGYTEANLRNFRQFLIIVFQFRNVSLRTA